MFHNCAQVASETSILAFKSKFYFELTDKVQVQKILMFEETRPKTT